MWAGLLTVQGSSTSARLVLSPYTYIVTPCLITAEPVKTSAWKVFRLTHFDIHVYLANKRSMKFDHTRISLITELMN